MGSAGVKIEFKGLSQILAKYQKLPETVEKAISDGINMAAGVVEGSAKRLCPVDTGHLRGSIHVMKEATPNNMKAIVGTNVEYAPYIEFGHRTPSGGHTAGIHYLERAIMNHMGQYKSIIEKELSK
jgi:hypothetical protein